MHVLQGGLGQGKTLAADTKLDNAKHYNPAGFARRPPEAAPPFQERSFAERAPRTEGGSSEIVILDGEGLIVAAGDSGHAFKFAPVMGRLIADAVEDVPSPLRQKFRWRPDLNPPRGEEEARHHG